jgi:hypothetical protein
VTEHPNLAAALVAFQSEIPAVGKGKTAVVPTKAGGQYKYTYADLADVSAAAMPVLTRHGLSFTSRPRRTDDATYELVGVLRHESGETDEGALPIRGGTPQEIGSSLTYMRRYLLGCMTGIVTDDDDDGAAAHDAPRTTSRRPKPQEPPPDPADEDEVQDPHQKAALVAVHAAFTRAGITDRAQKHAYCTRLLDRDVTSTKELMPDEVQRVIRALAQDAQEATRD